MTIEALFDELIINPENFSRWGDGLGSWGDPKHRLEWNSDSYHDDKRIKNFYRPDTDDEIRKLMRSLVSEPIQPFNTIHDISSILPIKSELLGKSIKFGEYQIHVNVFELYNHNEFEDNIKYVMDDFKLFVYIVFSHKGCFKTLAYVRFDSIFSYENGCKKSARWECDVNVYNTLAEQIINKLNLQPTSELDFIEPVTEIIDYKPRERYAYEIDDAIKQANCKYLDLKSIIEPEITKGVFKPTPETIEIFLKSPVGVEMNYPLKDLGVHTIHMRGNAYFSATKYFDLDGVKIKAPKKVIKDYSYEKYAVDQKMAQTILKEKQDRIDRENRITENNKFTLMRKGVVIFEHIDKNIVQEYLDGYVASDTDEPVEFDKFTLNEYVPLLKKFNIDRYELVYWGTYFRYELAGERCDFNYEDLNKHLSEDIIHEIDEEVFATDEKLIEHNYGWPERGASLLVIIKNDKGEYELVEEDYDIE